MFDETLNRDLTIKYLRYLGESAESMLTKDEVLREDMDSLQREFRLFQERVFRLNTFPKISKIEFAQSTWMSNLHFGTVLSSDGSGSSYSPGYSGLAFGVQIRLATIQSWRGAS